MGWLHSLCNTSFIILLALFSQTLASQPLNEALEKRLSQLEGDILALKSGLSVNTAEIESNAGAIESNNEAIVALDNSAYVGVCAYLGSTQSAGLITYDRIFSSYITDHSLLSISTGAYTATTSGLYMVSWSAHSFGEANVNLFKQGVELSQADYFSVQDTSNGYRWDQGSTTTMIHLCPGEKINLEAIENTYYIRYLQFCVHLAKEMPSC